jgi:SAM-dependent methyltransferase
MTRLKTIKAYYESRYVPGDMAPSRRSPDTFRRFLGWLDVKPGDRLLDVACGAGGLLQCAGPEIAGWGTDLSERAVRMARQVAPQAHISVGDMQRLSYADRRFDYVTNFGGLEHAPDMQQALLELKRVCSDEGKLCIVVPNADFFWYRVLALKGTQQATIEEHLLTLAEWRELIRAAGLHIVHTKADPGPNIRTDFGLAVFIRGIVRRLALIVTTLMPLAATYQFVFICSKRPQS